MKVGDERNCTDERRPRKKAQHQRDSDEHLPRRDHPRPCFNSRIGHVFLVPRRSRRWVLRIPVEACSEKFGSSVPIELVQALGKEKNPDSDAEKSNPLLIHTPPLFSDKNAK